MERREPSVRELFRTASRLAQTFVLRRGQQLPQSHFPVASAAAHALAGMARTHSGGSTGSGGGGPMRRRSSHDQPRPPSALGRPASRGDGPAGGSVWPEGSRPTTPTDDPGV